jgi:glycine/D-amino acid oxidase-like deaminating enzyme
MTNTFAPQSIESLTGKKLPGLARGSKVAVVGAGAFGGWTALWLLRSGMKVTLIDAWGAGNSRSSSGDETRVIRSTYGANEFYFDLNVRALELWKEHQQKWERPVFFNTGVLWLCYEKNTPIVDDSIPFARKHAMEYRHFSVDDLKKQYPIVNTEDLDHGWLDPFGGYLKARESCQLVAETFVREGGELVIAHADADSVSKSDGLQPLLSNGESPSADLYIYACGSWLGKLFPDVLGPVITCSKQEAYYFGVPAGRAKEFDNFPVWVDVDGSDYYYGIPGNANRGFKIGVDRRGKPFDPTSGERALEPEVLAHARKFIGHRFPDLRDAPLVESRVCPYENSPDGNFIFQQHPETERVYFLGGGSGHGFKHGPAWGEWVAKKIVAG